MVLTQDEVTHILATYAGKYQFTWPGRCDWIFAGPDVKVTHYAGETAFVSRQVKYAADLVPNLETLVPQFVEAFRQLSGLGAFHRTDCIYISLHGCRLVQIERIDNTPSGYTGYGTECPNFDIDSLMLILSGYRSEVRYKQFNRLCSVVGYGVVVAVIVAALVVF